MQTAAPTRRVNSPRWANPPVRWLLGSPLHALLDKQLMLVTTKGRISSRRITIPVGYLRSGDAIYVLVSDPYSKFWWRNLEGGARVEVTLCGKVLDAEASVLHSGFEPILEAYCKQFGGIARMLGVRVAKGAVDQRALHELARQVVMVRFRFDTSRHAGGLFQA